MQLRSNNSNYVVLLGIVNWSAGTVSWTNAHKFAHPMSSAPRITTLDLPAGDYVWNIFSNNGTVGQPFAFGVNPIALTPGSPDIALHASTNLLDVYTFSGANGFRRNGATVNLNYTYNYDSRIQFPGTGWSSVGLSSSISNPNIRGGANGLLHIGSYRFYQGSAVIQHHNVIVFAVDGGTLVSHQHQSSSPRDYFEQIPTNPVAPLDNYHLWLSGLENRATPRAIDNIDWTKSNWHYVVFSFNEGKVVEFVSPLNWEWTSSQGSNRRFANGAGFF